MHHNGSRPPSCSPRSSALILVVGCLVGGSTGLVIAFVISLAINGYSYFNSDKLALRSMHAVPVTGPRSSRGCTGSSRARDRAPGSRCPRLYVSPTNAPNAFATGRNPEHAAVCCTEGILGAARRARAARRPRPRAVARLQPRHPHRPRSRRRWRARSCSSRSSPTSSAGRATTRTATPSRSWRSRSSDRSPPSIIQLAISRSREYQADESGADADPRPAGPGQRAAQDRAGRRRRAAAARAAAADDQRADDRQPVQDRRRVAAVLDPPADRGADRPARGDGVRRLPPRPVSRDKKRRLSGS